MAFTPPVRAHDYPSSDHSQGSAKLGFLHYPIKYLNLIKPRLPGGGHFGAGALTGGVMTKRKIRAYSGIGGPAYRSAALPLLK